MKIMRNRGRTTKKRLKLLAAEFAEKTYSKIEGPASTIAEKFKLCD